MAPVNNSRDSDLIFLTPEDVTIADGASALSATPETATLSISGAAATAAGLFAYDRRAFPQSPFSATMARSMFSPVPG